MHIFTIFPVFVIVLPNIALADNFPVEIERCKYEDEKCLIDVMTNVITKYPEGYPPLNLVGIDPLKIDSMTIVQDPQNPVSINLKFTNTLMTGLKKMKFYRATVSENLDKSRFEIQVEAKVPLLTHVGSYEIQGHVLILPISGHGQCNLTFENGEAKLKAIGHIEIRNDEEYVKLTKINLNFDTSRLHMSYENLFNGNKALGDSMNMFLNENWQQIFTELKPSIENSFSEVLLNAIQGPFNKIPYKSMFLFYNKRYVNKNVAHFLS